MKKTKVNGRKQVTRSNYRPPQYPFSFRELIERRAACIAVAKEAIGMIHKCKEDDRALLVGRVVALEEICRAYGTMLAQLAKEFARITK